MQTREEKIARLQGSFTSREDKIQSLKHSYGLKDKTREDSQEESLTDSAFSPIKRIGENLSVGGPEGLSGYAKTFQGLAKIGKKIDPTPYLLPEKTKKTYEEGQDQVISYLKSLKDSYAQKSNQNRPEDEGIIDRLESGATSMGLQLPKYAAAGALGGPIGFGLLGAVDAIGDDKGAYDIAKDAVSNAALGTAFEAVAPLKALQRIPLLGLTGAAITKANNRNATGKDLLESGVSTGLLAGIGGGNKSVRDLYKSIEPISRPEVTPDIPLLPEKTDSTLAAEQQQALKYLEGLSKGSDFSLQTDSSLPKRIEVKGPETTKEVKRQIQAEKQTKLLDADKKDPDAFYDFAQKKFVKEVDATPKVFLGNEKVQEPTGFTTREEVTPETKKTVRYQMESLNVGRNKAVLITPGEEIPISPKKSFKTLDTDVGKWIYDPLKVSAKTIKEKVANGTHGEILGHIEPKSPAANKIVEAVKNGDELKTSVVSPQNVVPQYKELKRQFPDAEIKVGDDPLAQDIINQRESGPVNNEVNKSLSDINNSEKERGVITNVKNANNIPLEVKDQISGSYEVQNQAQEIAKARAEIAKDRDAATKKYFASRTHSGETVALATELAKDYISTGENQMAQRILEHNAPRGTQGGQASAMYNQLDKTTPEGALLQAIKDKNYARESLPQHKKLKLEAETRDVVSKLKKANDEVFEQVVKESIGKDPIYQARENAKLKNIASLISDALGGESGAIGNLDLDVKKIAARQEIINRVEKTAEETGKAIDDVLNELKIHKVKYAQIKMQNERDARQKTYQKGMQDSTDPKQKKSIENAQTKTIRMGLKSSGLNLGDVVRQNFSFQDQTQTKLIDYLVQDSGYSPEEAKAFADKISNRFRELATEKKRQILNQKFKKRLKKNSPRTDIDRMIELSNIGGFDHGEYRETIANKMGLPSLTPEQGQQITKLAQHLQTEAGKKDKFGNPTSEYFVRKRELENYTKSLNEGDLMGHISAIMRNVLLTSVKTPLKVAVETGINSAVESGVKKVSYQMTSGANPELASEYFKTARDTFNKSHYTLASMTSMNEGNIFGDSFSHHEGTSRGLKGLARKTAKVLDKLAIEKGHAITFNAAFENAFADTADLESTRIAKEERLTGKALKARARELFTKATEVGTKDPIGKSIREKAQQDAMRVTNTNSTYGSWLASKMKEGLNKVLPGAHIGDMLVPFSKIPGNIIANSIGVAGGDFVKGAVELKQSFSEKAVSGKGNFIKPTQTLVRAIGSIAAASLIAAQFDPDDDYDSKRGMVKIGNHWVSLELFGLLGPSIEGFLDAKKTESEDDDSNILNKVEAYGAGATKGLKRLPVVKEILDLNRYGAKSFAKDFVTSRLSPGIVGDVNKSLKQKSALPLLMGAKIKSENQIEEEDEDNEEKRWLKKNNY